MTQDNINDLPDRCNPEIMRGMAHVRGRSAQLALRTSAFEMLETYTIHPGVLGTQVSNEWLGGRQWQVQLLRQSDIRNSGPEAMFDPLLDVLKSRRVTHLYGTYVGGSSIASPTAVWRVPVDRDLIPCFFEAHSHSAHMLFPEDRSFAIHGTEDVYAAFAGPEDFLREALLPKFQGEGALADLKDYMDHDFGEGAFASMLPHYAPFLFDD